MLYICCMFRLKMKDAKVARSELTLRTGEWSGLSVRGSMRVFDIHKTEEFVRELSATISIYTNIHIY